MVIAIDGPAGSGKSTVAREVAKRLKCLYIDTGAMYRALTLAAINSGLDFKNEEALVQLAKNTDIELKESSGSLKVFLDGQDVSERIRSMSVTTKVKFPAALKGVRENMVRLQRKLGRSPRGAVLEGRDIGTVVFPRAEGKFYLEASLDTRVTRRFEEMKEKGFSISREEVKSDVLARDKADMTRVIATLVKAKDALEIDTTGMTVEEVVRHILKAVKK